MAVDLRRNTYVRWRNDIKAHWCWWIVNPKSTQPLTKLGHSWQGQTKGGSEMGKYPLCQEERQCHLPPWCRILPPTKRGTLVACRGVASYPPFKMMKNQKWQPEHKDMLTKRGDSWTTPRCHPVHWVEQASKITPTECWTAKDSIDNNRRLQ